MKRSETKRKQSHPEKTGNQTALPASGTLPNSGLLMLECGYKPYLKAEWSDWEIAVPDFLRRNRRRIKEAIRRSDSCDPRSREHARAAARLKKLIAECNAERREFHRRIARDLCSRYSAIFVIDPKLSELYYRHGSIMMDYGFSQFFAEMKKEACRSGTAVFIDNEPPAGKLLQDLEGSSDF